MALSARFPAVAELLTNAEPDLLVHLVPGGHRRRFRSANPLERANKEIKARSTVGGIFPTRASLIRLFGMVLFEQDDERQDGQRYFSLSRRPRSTSPLGRQEGTTTLLIDNDQLRG